jgi:hypothetical protein
LSSGGGGGFDENAWRNRIEATLYELQKTQWNNVARITSLETSRDNDRTRHSSTPAWIFGTIAATVSIAGFLFNLYLAGLRP